MAKIEIDWKSISILKSLAMFFKIHERWRSSFKTQALKGGGEVGVGEGEGATAISEVQVKSAERAANDNAINGRLTMMLLSGSPINQKCKITQRLYVYNTAILRKKVDFARRQHDRNQ